MRKTLLLILFAVPVSLFGQDHLIPLGLNPYLEDRFVTKSGATLDSTFVYTYSNLELPVFDDFSISKWVTYHEDFGAAGVTSTLYHKLIDEVTITPTDPAIGFCDSTQAKHDTIVISDGVTIDTFSTYFNTGIEIVVNDLSQLPIGGPTMTLYQECYVIIDSVIDGVLDPTQDTVFYNPLYVQDSARIFTADITNGSEIWLDDFACHNYRYPIDPKSLGVATFDGVSNDGYPYEFGVSTAYGDADVLTSKPINLSGKSNVFLSFLYQPKGFGNSPETEDSLILEMYSPGNDLWYNTWSVSGDEIDDVWHMAHIEISASTFLDNGFQFRFRNKASLSGNLDHWHIDYVDLRENSSLDDTLIDDLAISYPISSLLNTYTHVPWDHYNNLSDPEDEMQSEYELLVMNNFNVPKLTTAGSLTIDGNNFSLPVAALNWEVGQNIYNFGVGDQPYVFPQNNSIDQADFDAKVNISTSSINQVPENDTTYYTQEFRNFYAYDDGTAESGYGLLDNNAELAYKFEAYEADTLTGVLMKFVPNVSDVTGNVFLLTIWEDNNGEPGNIIYQDDFFDPHYPDYAAAKGQYHYYKFNGNQHIPVPKTFYVGWEQIEDENMYIGFDLNNNNIDKIFYNSGGNWVNASFPGSLIMRPVFSTGLNHTLSTDYHKVDNINMYPNPVNNVLTVDGLSDGDHIRVFDITGKMMITSYQSTLDCSMLTSGFYIVSVYNNAGDVVSTQKLIKE